MRKCVFLAGIAVLLLVGCKPTEKNYRAAYDAALNKRAQAQESLAAEGLITEDAPRRVTIDGKEFSVIDENIKVDSGDITLGPVLVAVARFKMPTNARAGADALRGKGYEAVAARAVGEKWYTIAGSFRDVGEAASFIGRFCRDNPGFQFIGLDGEPVIIRK